VLFADVLGEPESAARAAPSAAPSTAIAAAPSSRGLVELEDAAFADALEAERHLAARLPPELKLGTSSWTFSGWRGLVFPRSFREAELPRAAGLRAYAERPLFRSVGIDRAYYRPLERRTLEEYGSALPSGFQALVKIWGGFTQAVDPRTRAPNPDFLDAEHCTRVCIEPVMQHFEQHLGVFLFEVAPLWRSELPTPRAFAARLRSFLRALPRGPRYAVELRNPELLSPAYFEALAQCGVAHAANFWERMPPVSDQLAADPGEPGFRVLRLLLPPGRKYEERKRECSPFDRVIAVEQAMREDALDFVARALRTRSPAFIIVNNKAEGSAPLTLRALAEAVADRFGNTGGWL
jgi:uncharacterized protein YecE (DUF72 family)